MALSRSEAARSAVDRLRSRPWGVAVSVLADGMVEFLCDPGVDDLNEDTQFQVGSITKTVTGLLIADCVVRGEAALDDTLGSILGDDAGQARHVTLLDLATQHSGLPRVPPNLHLDRVDRTDPYAMYTEAELLTALTLIERPGRGTHTYSNFGFMLLGVLLARITTTSFSDLAAQRVFSPLGMVGALIGVPESSRRLPAYDGTTPVPWWNTQLPGAGGLVCSIRDLAQYLGMYLNPPQSLASAVDLALRPHAAGPPTMGLAWIHQGGGHWHNGATGGFRSFVAFHKPTQTGVALLVNSKDIESLDRIGMAILTDLAGSGR